MTGHWKTADELINMYSDLVLHSNGGVLGFIDPLHPKVGIKCIIIVTGWLMCVVI